MAKVNLDVPEDLHIRVKQLQLDQEAKGDRTNLRDLYYEIIRQGLQVYKPKQDNK